MWKIFKLLIIFSTSLFSIQLQKNEADFQILLKNNTKNLIALRHSTLSIMKPEALPKNL